ncbi:hypothetical protein [Thalassobacillus hwangdonensis]|uniref:Uncharacterized protein n=1 Tax=Thalassobacillus hwangdonensis TaxID=546108 RepID=A0ABW3L3T0_9BACI
MVLVLMFYILVTCVFSGSFGYLGYIAFKNFLAGLVITIMVGFAIPFVMMLVKAYIGSLLGVGLYILLVKLNRKLAY